MNLVDDFKRRIQNAKKKQLCNCAFCGQMYITDNITGKFTDFFRYDTEGNFWQLLGFTIKWIVFFFSFWYIGAQAIVLALQDEQIINYLCKQ